MPTNKGLIWTSKRNVRFNGSLSHKVKSEILTHDQYNQIMGIPLFKVNTIGHSVLSWIIDRKEQLMCTFLGTYL